MPGLLPPVEKLRLSITEEKAHLNISWEAPFTFDVPGYNPDIRDYCLVISTIPPSETGTISYCVRKTYVVYRPLFRLRCYTLNVSVMGRNFVGNSPKASVQYRTCSRDSPCDEGVSGTPTSSLSNYCA